MKSDLYTAIAELAAERNMPKEVVTGASSTPSRPSTRRRVASRKMRMSVSN